MELSLGSYNYMADIVVKKEFDFEAPVPVLQLDFIDIFSKLVLLKLSTYASIFCCLLVLVLFRCPSPFYFSLALSSRFFYLLGLCTGMSSLIFG
jgi:hypothetical protein